LTYDFAVPNATKSSSAVCFLVINKMEVLPSLAINSVLLNSNQNVIVGYISKSDVSSLPKTERVSYLDLSDAAKTLGVDSSGKGYQSFDQDAFFSLVQLKWAMLARLLQSGDYSYLIYNDVDVLWIQDPTKVIEDSFSAIPYSEILIQNFTSDPSQPNLCMGFVAFRNSDESRKIIQECASLHNSLLESNPRTGDDDVISEYYRHHSYTQAILQLPQGLFPVGNFANLFSGKSFFPGLTPFKPYIFHANFVVGMKKKTQLSYLMLHVFSRNQQVSSIRIMFIKFELALRGKYLMVRRLARKFVK
jgi:hypothetical protein